MSTWVKISVLISEKGKLPALGWNSWNAFSCGVDEDKIMTAANEIISLGLKDVGYNYVNSTNLPLNGSTAFGFLTIHLQLTTAGLSRILEIMSPER